MVSSLKMQACTMRKNVLAPELPLFIFLSLAVLHRQNVHALEFLETEPSVGAYQMNVQDEIVKVFSETRNTQVILPNLKQSYYTETTIQLVCNATYPVQWVYTSTTGTPVATAATFRIASNEAVVKNDGKGIFQARVTFSFMDIMQEGNYSCESISEASMSAAYIYVKVGEEGANGFLEVPRKPYTLPGRSHSPRRNRKLRMRILQKKIDRVICCSRTRSDFLKIRFLKCESVSDCRLKQADMENNRNCTQSYCNQDRVTRLEDSKQTCSIFDMHNDLEDYDSMDSEFGQGVFQCSNGVDSQNEYLTFTKLNDNTIVSEYSILPSQTTQILRIETELTSRGAEIFLTCNANSFFFSNGLKWAFQNSSRPEFDFYDEGHGRVSLKFPTKNLEGRTVYCFAPVWNSKEWKSTSVSF